MQAESLFCLLFKKFLVFAQFVITLPFFTLVYKSRFLLQELHGCDRI